LARTYRKRLGNIQQNMGAIMIIQCKNHPEWGTFGVREDHGEWFDIFGRGGWRVLYKSEFRDDWEIVG
jgi:hypothetical protein